jgi:shikimate dehydrogenase
VIIREFGTIRCCRHVHLAGEDAERIVTKGTLMGDTTPFLKLLTGALSTPAGQNPTGVMVEAAYAHHDIPARYINCDVAPAHLADAVRGAVAMGWIGFNCSLPHKQSVIKYLDELGKSASLIGAVNCVVRRGDRLIGENTDGQGFLTALRAVTDPQGTRVTEVTSWKGNFGGNHGSQR